MSAWIVSRQHIDALVQALGTYEIVEGKTPDEIGQVLWVECLRSVKSRYPNDRSGDRPGYGDRDMVIRRYTYTALPVKIPRKTLIDAVTSYRYQSCEHDGWAKSKANAWTLKLKAGLEELESRELLPDLSAPEGWSIDEDTFAALLAVSA